MAAAAAADTAARVAAALPAGVRLEDVNGPWVLDETEVSFETDAADGGRLRVLEGGGGGTLFAGTYGSDAVAIQQVALESGSAVNAWLAEARLQHWLRASGRHPDAAYGALLRLTHEDDGADRLHYYTVAPRTATSGSAAVDRVGATTIDALARFATDEVEVAGLGCRALCHLAEVAEHQVPLVRDGAHAAVMTAARAHAGNVEVARAACTALRYLSRAADNRILLVRDGAHVAVMAAAQDHRDDEEVARYVSSVLRDLAAAIANFASQLNP